MRGGLIMLTLVGGIVMSIPFLMVPDRPDRADDIAMMAESQIPDLGAVSDPARRKRMFLEFLAPRVHQVNREISGRRGIVESVREKLLRGESLPTWEATALPILARRYRLRLDEPSISVVDELLLRVDVLPPSLVLAQAAAESAWGTSRFARTGNAMFGQWCFDEGCGLVPQSRRSGATHQVRRFPTVLDSIRAYFLNINTHAAYAELREMRAQQRRSLEGLRGPLLAAGLIRYSERGDVYVQEIRNIIQANELENLDPLLAVRH